MQLKNMDWLIQGISAIVASLAAVLSSSIMPIAPACLPGMKEQIVDLAMNNAGIRDIARALHISIDAVVRTLKNSRRDV